MTLFIIGLVLIGGYLLIEHLRKRYYRYREGRDISIDPPKTKRSDLLFGFYGRLDNQREDTKDFTNLDYEFMFDGVEGLVNNMKLAKRPTIIDVGYFLTQRNATHKSIFRQDAAIRLKELLDRLKIENLLQYILGFTPGDEPNSQFENIEHWHQCVKTIKDICVYYPELANLKIVMLLNGAASNEELKTWCPHADLVGFDLYKKKSAILEPKRWPNPGGLQVQLESWLREDQKTFLVPGGSYKQNPWPFVYYAQKNPKVAFIVAFLWPSTKDGDLELTGIRDIPEIKEEYIKAGNYILNTDLNVSQ
jgi:hypothetical protein